MLGFSNIQKLKVLTISLTPFLQKSLTSFTLDLRLDNSWQKKEFFFMQSVESSMEAFNKVGYNVTPCLCFRQYKKISYFLPVF